MWAFDYTPPIRTFLSQVSIKGKKLALFCCHEGSKGRTLENMEKDLPGNTVIGKSDYANVFKDREATANKAREWASGLDK